MDNIYLVGSDDARSGGNTMREAAQQMNNAASSIQFAFENHQRFLDDWLQRLEHILISLKSENKQ